MRKDRSYARLLNLDRIATPAEIVYLVSSRQTLVGEIDKMRKEIKDFPARIKERNTVIAAIDLMLDRHKLRIDARAIPGVSRNKPRLLPYGKLQQFVLRVFREASDGAVLGTFVIASEVHRMSGLQLERKAFNNLHKVVLKSLNHLQKSGVVERTNKPDAPSTTAATWRVVD